MSITLTDISNLRVFQRNTSNQGSVLVSGSCTGATSVEARVVLHGTSTEVVGWTVIDAAPTSTFSGTLSNIPQGGWYNVQVRVGNDPGTTSNGTNKWGVGVLIGIIGQSLALYWNIADGGETLTADNLLSLYDGSWSVPQYDGCINFGNTIIANLSIPVGLIFYPIGGTGLVSGADVGNGYWLDTSPGSIYDDFQSAVNTLGGVIEHIVWAQGETDGAEDTSKVDYYNGLGTFFTTVNSDISWYDTGNIPTSFNVLGKYNFETTASVQGVREAQLDFISLNGWAYYGSNIFDQTYIDQVHIDAAGIREMAARQAQMFLFLKGEVSYYRGPHALYFLQIDSTKIDIYLSHDGGSDFTPTSGITGFRVADGGGNKTITAVVRQTASIVRITVSTNFSGTIRVDYVYGENPDGSAALTDNSGLGLPLEAFYNLSESATSTSTTTSTSSSTSTTTTTTSTSTSTTTTTTSTSSSTSTSTSTTTVTTSTSTTTTTTSSSTTFTTSTSTTYTVPRVFTIERHNIN